jgi:membrane protein DedA with SNARE-associated domain
MDVWLQEVFGRFHYLAPFVVLLLCGVGLPLPEEVTLLASGLLLHQGEVEFVPIVLVCSVAILLGDSVPFWLGRRYGMNALKVRWVRRIIHPERFSRLEKHFQRHGNWAVFMCRFFAGVRIPGYFMAGTMRMGYGRFLLLDVLGVLLSVPASIWLGKVFADQIDRLHKSYRQLHLVLAFAVVTLVIVLVVRARSRKAAQQPSQAVESPGSGGDNPS